MYTITLVLCAEVEVGKSAIYAGNSVYLGNRVASQKKSRSQNPKKKGGKGGERERKEKRGERE